MPKNKTATCKPQGTVAELVAMFRAKYADDAFRFEDMPGANATWAPIRLITLYEMAHQEPRPTHDQIAAALKLERSTITRKINKMKWPEFEERLRKLCTMTTEDFNAESADVERLKALADDGRKSRQRHIEQLASMRNIEEAIVSNSPPIALPSFKIRYKHKSGRTPEHVVLLLSDLHVGQKFTNKDTGGLNEYNPELFVQRAVALRDSLAYIYELHSELYDLPELHVLAMGDIVQGTNTAGEWGGAYNSLSVDAQAMLASKTISDMLSTWSAFFKKVNFVGVVGNHGRGGPKNTEKISANWDNMVYHSVQNKMSSHKNVVVDYTDAWWRQLNINGTEIMMVHGDNVRGTLNQLLYEEQRLQGLLCGRSGRYFSILCMGHFHTHEEVETSLGKILVNGSFVGGDIYSMHKLRVNSRPTQVIFGVHPRHGMTWKYSLDLDYASRPKEPIFVPEQEFAAKA